MSERPADEFINLFGIAPERFWQALMEVDARFQEWGNNVVTALCKVYEDLVAAGFIAPVKSTQSYQGGPTKLRRRGNNPHGGYR